MRRQEQQQQGQQKPPGSKRVEATWPQVGGTEHLEPAKLIGRPDR